MTAPTQRAAALAARLHNHQRELAAEFGLPYAFAHHPSPDLAVDAMRFYRERFRPTPVFLHADRRLSYELVASIAERLHRNEVRDRWVRPAGAARGTGGVAPTAPFRDLQLCTRQKPRGQAKRRIQPPDRG